MDAGEIAAWETRLRTRGIDHSATSSTTSAWAAGPDLLRNCLHPFALVGEQGGPVLAVHLQHEAFELDGGPG